MSTDDTAADHDYVALVAIAGLPHDGIREITHDGVGLIVCAVAGNFHVLENRCSHQHKPLAKGRVRDGCLHCPWHGARFDLVTGAALAAPATAPVHVYPSRVHDGMLEAVLGPAARVTVA